jgi:hypothetical protein
MENIHHLQIIGDLTIATLLARVFGLILSKAFFEPIAAFVGRRGYNWVDRLFNDKLPNLPGED